MTKQHPLAAYARTAGVSMEAIAAKAGCSRVTLYRVMRGVNCTTDLLSRISAATGGAVTVVQLLPATEAA